MSKRYFKKVEILERELEFIYNHEIKDEVTERANLYSLQVCVESGNRHYSNEGKRYRIICRG